VPTRDFHRFLERSLALLAAEVPAAYQGVEIALRVCPMRVVVDGEGLLLRFRNGYHEIASDGDAAVELRTTSASILDLIDGRLDFIDALLGEQLFLQGTLDRVVSCDCALSSYLAGAVRADGFPSLLSDYRLRVVTGNSSARGGADE
jgi:hypothetical protein